MEGKDVSKLAKDDVSKLLLEWFTHVKKIWIDKHQRLPSAQIVDLHYGGIEFRNWYQEKMVSYLCVLL